MDVLDGSRNLTQQLTHELGKAIVQGKYAVNAAFPTEAELSARFDISRSVTREAVKMLTAKGLVSSRPRKGIRVQPAAQWNMFDNDVLRWTLSVKPSLQLHKEFTQLRAAMEPEAVALAAASATTAQLRALELALQRIESAARGEDDPFEADVEFHIRLLEATNNRFFVQFCDFVRAALRVGIACARQLDPPSEADLTTYRALYHHTARGEIGEGRQRSRQSLDDLLDRISAAVGADVTGVSVKGAITV